MRGGCLHLYDRGQSQRIGTHRLRPSCEAHDCIRTKLAVYFVNHPACFRIMKNPELSAENHPHNLPALLSSFVGRTREVAEVRRLLEGERLVTLTGAGGSGKTRLALRAATAATMAFEDGAWLIELASLSDPALVTQTVAATVGVPEQRTRPLLETLIEALHGRRTLLVLDNCEHLVQACAQLAQDLLQGCPGLTILATSREPLGISGEVIRIVPPLSMPSGADATSGLRPDAARLGRSEAVQLFVTRAQAAAPGFELNNENACVVAQICLRLDGMPLAIELAAARLRALSVAQVAELMGDRFQLLTGGSRTAPARQRTLEAALDWSYNLLPEVERRVLQRLSVFAGGCTLEAAEAVCSDGQLATHQVREALAHLVDKSLLMADQSSREVRYRLLETIREYGRKKLPDSEAAACTDLHLHYLMKWSKELELLLLGPELARGVQLFAEDYDNVRLALDWSMQSGGNAESGLRLAAAAWNYWRVVGYHTEGRARLESLLMHPEAQKRTIARADALHCVALHAFYQSEYPVAARFDREAQGIYEELGQAGRRGLARSVELLAEVASETGNYERALSLFQQALPIFEEVGDIAGLGDNLKMLGFNKMRSGNMQEAKGWFDRGLEACRRSGDLRHLCSALSGLGEWHIRAGQYDEARKLLSESLSISRDTGEKWNIAINLGSLAWVQLLEGHLSEMAKLLRESLAIRVQTGDRSGIAWCLEKMVEAATLEGKFAAAASTAGAAAALRRPVGSEMDAPDRTMYERDLARVRKALGEPHFTDEWSAGEKMTVDDVIEMALSQFEAPAGSSDRARHERPGGLTERELETAVLIAKGNSNREIAAAMTVGLKTVETYVTRILDKLALELRVQVATWAMEQGLLKKEVK